MEILSKDNNGIVTVLDDILCNRQEVYNVGKKVTVIEPMDEYWRECVCLFLAAVIYYLNENKMEVDGAIENYHASENKLCYSAVLDFIQRARRMDIDELTAFFDSVAKTSEAYKYYSAFWDKSGRTVVSVISTAYIKIKGIYFDKQRIAEFERVFEIC